MLTMRRNDYTVFGCNSNKLVTNGKQGRYRQRSHEYYLGKVKLSDLLLWELLNRLYNLNYISKCLQTYYYYSGSTYIINILITVFTFICVPLLDTYKIIKKGFTVSLFLKT